MHMKVKAMVRLLAYMILMGYMLQQVMTIVMMVNLLDAKL